MRVDRILLWAVQLAFVFAAGVAFSAYGQSSSTDTSGQEASKPYPIVTSAQSATQNIASGNTTSPATEPTRDLQAEFDSISRDFNAAQDDLESVSRQLTQLTGVKRPIDGTRWKLDEKLPAGATPEDLDAMRKMITDIQTQTAELKLELPKLAAAIASTRQNVARPSHSTIYWISRAVTICCLAVTYTSMFLRRIRKRRRQE